MTDFNKIVILRNEGKTQDEIAQSLGISRRSVIRYLKSGKIPVYKRDVPATRINPMFNFMDVAEAAIKTNPTILLSELFEHLKNKGYVGSFRTLRRKTSPIRKKYKSQEIFFKREATPGEVMEGDFTEIKLLVGGVLKRIYIWIVSLPYSNTYFVTPFYNLTFECFAEGSVNAFNEFGGVAKKYRLDNLSPVVKKILNGKERLVTQRYAQFQEYYGFKQDFCNPARGNEKGNVEANNKYFKNKITSQISLNNLSFANLDSLKEFMWKVCRSNNNEEKVKNKFMEEHLSKLPQHPFESFRSEIVKINKYSLFNLGTSGHMYSVPSKYIGLTMEARVYSDKIVVSDIDKIVCVHKRLMGVKGLVSINVEHIIEGLLRKPGAFKDWKYKEVVFERPVWRDFYAKISDSDNKDKEFLRCLNLISEHGRDNLTLAMELAMNSNLELNRKTLQNVIKNEFSNVLSIEKMPVNLDQYNFLLNGENNEPRTQDVSRP